MSIPIRNTLMLLAAPMLALAACKSGTSNSSSTAQTTPVASPCSKAWPSYWQDPDFAKTGMWEDQTVSDTPTSQKWDPSNPAYTNPPFQIADAFDKGKPDDPAAQPWRDPKFDPLFDPKTPTDQKTKLAVEYGWDLMHYIQEGNINSGNINTDWNPCANTKRQWFNMPFQTYTVLQGREFIHGLTREAPVTLSVSTQPSNLGTTVWAVAFYNGNAAATLGSVWKPDGTVTMPKDNLAFAEGTVIGKLLFTTANASNMPILQNVPTWTANISSGSPTGSNPTYCAPPNSATMPQQSKLCQRTPKTVTLLQFDVATRDKRATNGWVFGTFVADGQAKAAEKNPWDRISLLGLIWGDDTPPMGHLASVFPVDPKKNGFTQSVIEWDVVDRLNKSGGSTVNMQPGHLGCNSRLNGPADNVNSSCMSCHGTASVPDSANFTPPLLSQFGTNLTPQCAAPNAPASGQRNNVTYAQMDSIYFAQTKCASPFQDKVNGVCIYGPNIPNYADHRSQWISTDFSLQMAGALVEWNEWQGDLKADGVPAAAAATVNEDKALKTAPPKHETRAFTSELPLRGE